jgi:hypothetical protein
MSKPPLCPTDSQLARNGIWHIAFILSEMVNDNAPLGWERYIPLAKRAIKEARDNDDKGVT